MKTVYILLMTCPDMQCGSEVIGVFVNPEDARESMRIEAESAEEAFSSWHLLIDEESVTENRIDLIDIEGNWEISFNIVKKEVTTKGGDTGGSNTIE